MDTVRILDQSGDTTVASEEVNSASLTNAEAVFNRLRDERHLAFAQPHGCWLSFAFSSNVAQPPDTVSAG